jgi:hypothetical protein
MVRAMGKVHAGIDDALTAWIGAQRMFFVATAPSGDGGLVNCSPRGGDPLVVLGPTSVAWLDRVGSGIETAAHLRENGRIVVMLCAFTGPPRIVRLHGRGEVLRRGGEPFARVRERMPGADLGVRAIVRVELTRISDSCGFGVPLYAYEGERPQLAAWAQKKGEAGTAAYVREKNALSIDGLPGLDPV